jgi:tRNA pseudouridine55 synthase
MAPPRSGVLLVAKPAGPTSHDVVARVRRSGLPKGTKVGHAGTLDPFATGLLLILVGAGTRFQRFLMALPKAYRATARFGAVSDTGDPTGEIRQTGGTTSAADVRAAAARLVGDIDQRVPMTSAVKVGGERLYRKAHRGEDAERPVRRVRVERLAIASFDDKAQEAELEIVCSSGTYVRQLVEDMGELCGAGAYCAALERTAIGPFRLADADDERLLPLSDALSFLPERRLGPDEEPLARNGRAVEASEVVPAHQSGGVPERVRLTAEGRLVAVAERRDGLLKPVTVVPR